ncbi:MAG: hypothetical protein ACM34H_07890 [Deltaproteobacteria bacterium]
MSAFFSWTTLHGEVMGGAFYTNSNAVTGFVKLNEEKLVEAFMR